MVMSLENVKAGDRVVHNGYQLGVEIVDRVTKTMIVINGLKYRKSDGRMIGAGKWSLCYISPASDDEICEIILKNREENARDKLRSRTFAGIPLDKLIEIEKIAREFDKGE